MKKFIFTCGGTAGHINPAIGVAGRLRELIPDAEILFIGAEGMMETELVPREGYEIKTVTISNISRSLSLSGLKHNVQTVKNVIKSEAEAKKIIRSFAPNAVIGTGGYVCYPVLKAAHSLGIPTLVHESNAVPGLTTKLLARSVDCVMVGFEHAAENYPKGVHVVYTGTPVRQGFETISKAEARARLGIPEEQPLVLSVWGSLGSDHINEIMKDLAPLAEKRGDFRLIHSAGKRGYPKLTGHLAACDEYQNSQKQIVEIREYIYNMPVVMAAADLIVCRSGASTLGELAAMGKPALLIPSPNVTNNHQEKNARLLEQSGAAAVLTEGTFDAASLYETISDMLRHRDRLAQMAAAMKSSAAKDATGTIAELILNCLR